MFERGMSSECPDVYLRTYRYHTVQHMFCSGERVERHAIVEVLHIGHIFSQIGLEKLLDIQMVERQLKDS